MGQALPTLEPLTVIKDHLERLEAVQTPCLTEALRISMAMFGNYVMGLTSKIINRGFVKTPQSTKAIYLLPHMYAPATQQHQTAQIITLKLWDLTVPTLTRNLLLMIAVRSQPTMLTTIFWDQATQSLKLVATGTMALTLACSTRTGAVRLLTRTLTVVVASLKRLCRRGLGESSPSNSFLGILGAVATGTMALTMACSTRTGTIRLLTRTLTMVVASILIELTMSKCKIR